MLSKTSELMAFKIKNSSIMIIRLLCGCVPSFLLVLAYIAAIDPAFARTPYDGDWSVVIVAHGGACDSNYRFGVQVEDGLVINDGGFATVQGRVTSTGLVGSPFERAANGPPAPAVSLGNAAAAFGEAKVRAAPAAAPG